MEAKFHAVLVITIWHPLLLTHLNEIVFLLATNDILIAKSYFAFTLLDFSIKFDALYYVSCGF